MMADPPRFVDDGDRSDLTLDLTVAIVEAVAEAKGVNPISLSETLYDVVDPDALAHLVQGFRDGPPADGTVSFVMSDCHVSIHDTGIVLARSERGGETASRTFDPAGADSAGHQEAGLIGERDQESTSEDGEGLTGPESPQFLRDENSATDDDD